MPEVKDNLCKLYNYGLELDLSGYSEICLLKFDIKQQQITDLGISRYTAMIHENVQIQFQSRIGPNKYIIVLTK